MAARLVRVKATLQMFGDGDDPMTPRELKGVSVIVRNNVATARLGTEVLVERAGVARVVPLARRSWQLHFEDPVSEADVWTITDERRACCGGR